MLKQFENEGLGRKCDLKAAEWEPQTKKSLQVLIEEGAGRGLPVVFDFDNTLIEGDIGESVLGVLAQSGRLTPATVEPGLSGHFQDPRSGKVITLAGCETVLDYYESLLSASEHQPHDLSPLANAYVWAAEVLAGLKPLHVVSAARTAYWLSGRPQVGSGAWPAPCFNPAMVELVAELSRRQYEIWIVSASNVWSVRWMVLQVLNPLLAQAGAGAGLRPERVIGLAPFLQDRAGRLFKDWSLVRTHPGYARLEEEALSALRITRWLQHPLPVYSGKVACILDAIGRPPFLCVGDSPSDHAMMAFSQHRLWIARTGRPQFQALTNASIARTGSRGWMIQPRREKRGF